MKYFSMFSGIGGFERGIEQAWNVLSAENAIKSTKEDVNVKSVLQSTIASGGQTTGNAQTSMQETGGGNAGSESWRHTVVSASAVENLPSSFSQSTISTTTGQRKDAELGEEESITKLSVMDSLTNTNYSATTATSQRDSMVNAPICVGYSEIDKYAIKVYERHFNGHRNYGNATTINPDELPDFDLLVGGFPCQAFSIAGKRKGFDDTRGTLFFDIARILANKRPRHLVLENVKGLLSHDSGKTFQTILGVLSDLGYRVEWQILNSKDFGVPQNRERIFIVGHLRGECGRKVLPITGTNSANTYIRTIRTGGASSFTEKHARDIIQINQPNHSNDRVYATDGISPTLNTMQGGNRQPFIAPVLTPDRLEKRQNGRRMKENGEPAFTVTAQDRHGLYDGARIRRLTPKECERLQGFPDDWTAGESDTQRYKMCGNAVTVNVIEAIMTNLVKCLYEQRK